MLWGSFKLLLNHADYSWRFYESTYICQSPWVSIARKFAGKPNVSRDDKRLKRVCACSPLKRRDCSMLAIGLLQCLLLESLQNSVVCFREDSIKLSHYGKLFHKIDVGINFEAVGAVFGGPSCTAFAMYERVCMYLLLSTDSIIHWKIHTYNINWLMYRKYSVFILHAINKENENVPLQMGVMYEKLCG